MVDWGNLGKQALELSKKASEKGIESFNDWRSDEERIQRVQNKKAVKLEKKNEKKYTPLRSKHIEYNEMTGQFELLKQLKGKFNQDDLLSYELIQDEASITKGGVSLGRAIVGNAVLGGAGMVLGGLSGKKETNSVVKNIKISISLRGKKGKIAERIIPIYDGKGVKTNDSLYKSYLDEAKKDMLILDKISHND
ncbi:hypothetical protein [Enterococcus gilvus]|uniref:hypothetical protein n=1 Tax=Enterococcus gilvus TaxID=160453 RepID=UPI003EDABCB5